MKKRKGFVSNSSSSSFICDITGREFSGWNMDLIDAEMRACQNGHTFDEKFYNEPSLVNKREIIAKGNSDYEKEETKDLDAEEFEEWWETNHDRDEDPPEFCPICSFRYAKQQEIMLFLLAQANIKLSAVLAQIKVSYGDWNNFNDKLLRNVKGEAFNDLDYTLEDE